MAAISIQTGFPKEILAKPPEMPPHNWLISGLDCVDHCGWEGCEKWAQETLFLTDEPLKKM